MDDWKWKVVALMFGFMALHAAVDDRSVRFIRGGVERGEPVMEWRFSGIEWACGKHGRETCWAGQVMLDLYGKDLELMTGRAR